MNSHEQNNNQSSIIIFRSPKEDICAPDEELGKRDGVESLVNSLAQSNITPKEEREKKRVAPSISDTPLSDQPVALAFSPDENICFISLTRKIVVLG